MKISSSIVGTSIRNGSTAGLGLAVEDFRQQRATTLLLDVAYIIEAHLNLTPRAGMDDTPAKHIAMFSRRATSGQCFHRPYLGTREFAANFALIPKHAELPPSELPPDQRNRDLGWMLHDISHDHAVGATPRFFRSKITNGVLDVQKCLNDGTSA
jgi:CRISPR-associated protein Cas5d